MTGTPDPPADPPGDPPPADPPPANEPPEPTREDVVRDPQALIDALGAARNDARRLERWKRDRERADAAAADAQKTELERATERASTAEASLATSQRETMTLRELLEQYLGDDPRVRQVLYLAPLMKGSTPEEVRAEATRARELFGAQPPGSRPPVDYGSGTRLGNGQPESGDAAFTQTIRRQAGRG